MSPRLSRHDRAKKLTPWRRVAGMAAILFLLLAGGSATAPERVRLHVIFFLIALGAWAILKGAQFIVARFFYEYEVGIGYHGGYAVAVGWAAVGLGIIAILLGGLGLIFS